jgi:cobalt-zinc-cadmium efflux system outer membrane protein
MPDRTQTILSGTSPRRRAWRLAALALGLAMAAGGAAAAEASAAPPRLTLRQVFDLAVAHSPDRAVLAARRAEAEAERRRADAYPNPELEVGAGWAGGRAADGESLATLAVEFSQPIEWPAARQARAAAAAAGVNAAAWDAALNRSALAAAVREAFGTVLLRRRMLALAREDAANAAEIEAVVSRRVEGGEAAELDRIKARLERLKADRAVGAEAGRLAAARTVLAALCGDGLPAEYELADGWPGDPEPAEPDREPAAALADHPALRLQEAVRSRREQELRLAGAARRPALAAGFMAAREYDANSVGGFLRLELPAWDRNAGGIAAAAARRDEADALLAKLRREIRRDVELAVEALARAREQRAAFEGGLRQAADEAYRIETLRYREGEVDFLHLLDTRRTARQVEVEYLFSQYDVQIARAGLDRALGKGDVEP